MIRLTILIACFVLPVGAAEAQSFLQVQGQPYFEGNMMFSVEDPAQIGAPVWIAFGLNPLPIDAPAPTQYGPLYTGVFKGLTFVGSIPPTGRLDGAFQMPPVIPLAVGVPYAVQAFCANQLSNPATLPFDVPYIVPSEMQTIDNPVPTTGANFGDEIAVGDLNDDGFPDIAVGAWYEDSGGFDRSGAAYVLWGPFHDTHLRLEPDPPLEFGFYGSCVLISDLTGDGIDDLLVGETSAYPTLPNGVGQLHLYAGGPSFSSVPILDIPSLETGLVASAFGRGAIAADLDGDTITDLALPMFKAEVAGFTDAGRIDVYWGPTFNSHESIENPVPQTSDFFGGYLAAGDVNGDSLVDLIEGSGRADVGGIKNVGRVHVFLSPDLELADTIDYPLTPTAHSRFGEDVAAEDLDGDGRAEIITADDDDHVFIFWGGDVEDLTLVPKPPTSITNPFGDTLYGIRLVATDVNGDGIPDVIISDLTDGLQSCPLLGSGLVSVALGPYYQTFHKFVDPAAACKDGFGFQICIADLDGTGDADLIIGSITADPGGISNAGRITVIRN